MSCLACCHIVFMMLIDRINEMETKHIYHSLIKNMIKMEPRLAYLDLQTLEPFPLEDYQ